VERDDATDILPPGAVVVAAAPGVDVAGVDASAPPEPPASLIGRTLGKFEILEVLGRGGAGDVYRAEQAQLGRSAVIKVLRRDVHTGPIRIDRFLREAKLASRLDHPYAAHVYAFGAEPDGTLWIAMEHVRGATLDELVARRGPIPPPIFGPLFARLCEVVHTAHELGIVHRDIKGSNVMVIERAGQLLPKLIDLGIAKSAALADDAHAAPDAHADAAAAAAEHLTQHGTTLGSPHYMSPEQWNDPSGVDARADVYALGVLAYRCVAGTVPFKFPERAALIDAHLHRPPPPLPERVPAPLADAVLRALEKDRAARWQTALAFGSAVQHAVGTAALEAVPIFDPYTRDVWLRAGPQPIADAIAHVAAATTTVEADAAVRELVAITCRWLAVLALSVLPRDASVPAVPAVREGARGVVGRDDAGPWLELARVAGAALADGALPGLIAALAGSGELAELAARLDDRERARSAAGLAADIAAAASALRPIEPLLAYQLVVGRADHDAGAESWQGPRRRDRERVVVWGEPLADGEVALLDAGGTLVARLSPLAQVIAPLPSAEPELFLLWRSGRGAARLVAAPWGFERDDDAAGERLAALTTEDSETQHDPADDASPYPGLAAYGVADAERFVGREREVEALANRLIRAPLIAVLGPSGAGKSSFIHAGVLPRLAEHYRVVTLRPGRHPLHALAALPEMSRDSQDESALIARLRELGESAPRGLVIVIDQLEELVTLCGDPDERRRFADTLAAAADATSAPVRVVVTLRDDFAAVIESEAAFRGKFEVFVLGTPPPEALRRIVIEPARRAAVAVDAAVVDDMVAEVAGRPASLPLLSFTASQLWATRDKTARRITHAAYSALGGVAGALSTYADQVYDGLARRDQDVVRALFARLVAGDGTRIPVPRRELEQLVSGARSSAPASGASAVLAHLIDARLLVVRDDDDRPERAPAPSTTAATGTTASGPRAALRSDIIEIVHECLAERWDRLARWRREDAADRALVGDLRAAARRWLDTQRRPDALWRGEALVDLRRLIGESAGAGSGAHARAASAASAAHVPRVPLTDDERAFAAASLDAARRARRVRRGAVVAVIAVLAAVAGVMAALGVAARDSADHARTSEAVARDAAHDAEERLTQSLVERGRIELNDGRALPSLAYFAAALQRGADSPGLRFMIAVASRAWPFEVRVDRGAGVDTLDATPDGGFVTGDHNGTLHWYGPTGAPAGSFATGFGDLLLASADRDHVLVVGHAGFGVIATDPATPAVHRLLGHADAGAPDIHIAEFGPAADEFTVVDDEAVSVYSLDCKLRRRHAANRPTIEAQPQFAGNFVIFSGGGIATALDLRAMTERQIATDVHGNLSAAQDGRDVAYMDTLGTAHVIGTDGKPHFLLHPPSTQGGVLFSPSGDRIVCAGPHVVTVYDRKGTELATYSVEVNAMGLVARGDDLWTGGDDGVIRHYRAGVLIASLPVHATPIMYLRLSGDLLGSFATDFTFAIVRADATQLVLAEPACAKNGFAPAYAALAYMCKDGHTRYYAGGKFIGETRGEHELGMAELDDTAGGASGRAAVTGRDEARLTIEVFGPGGVQLAQTANDVPGAHVGRVAFDDADHLLVLEVPKTGALWRWTFATNQWEKLFDVDQASAVARTAAGILVGYADGRLVTYAAGRAVHELQLGDVVDGIVVSRDGAVASVLLRSGVEVIVDSATGAITRRLEAGDEDGFASSFDDTDALLMRTARGTVTVWDRVTGDDLIYNLDLLNTMFGIEFGRGGRIELQGEHVGTIDLGRDTRPAAALVHDIACRVPFELRDGKLAPTTPDCAP
jgi:tRNA A-37 threonylcarbamoyl transferase component Bud32